MSERINAGLRPLQERSFVEAEGDIATQVGAVRSIPELRDFLTSCTHTEDHGMRAIEAGSQILSKQTEVLNQLLTDIANFGVAKVLQDFPVVSNGGEVDLKYGIAGKVQVLLLEMSQADARLDTAEGSLEDGQLEALRGMVESTKDLRHLYGQLGNMAMLNILPQSEREFFLTNQELVGQLIDAINATGGTGVVKDHFLPLSDAYGIQSTVVRLYKELKSSLDGTSE
jgi:hypothetical protein